MPAQERAQRAAAVRIAETDDALRRCWPVVRELRTRLDETRFLAQVKRQRGACGYRVAYLEDDGQVVAVAGYRMFEALAWGKTLYVDDLVTASTAQGAGYGSRLIDWLVDQARDSGCDEFHLDSGVQRFGAHRFYLHKGMDIVAHHFVLSLRDE